jgi:hypothetical protein
MPKIRKPPPKGILDQLVQRFREGRISSSDFLALKHWLESDPDVPKANGLSASKAERLPVAANSRQPSSPRAWPWKARK